MLFLSSRAHLRALSDGGLHLRGVCSGGFSGGRVLLHLPATQATHPAADPLLAAQSGRNHPHDLHHGSSQPAHAVPSVQHGHHQLQLSGRREFSPPLLPGPRRHAGAVFATAASNGLVLLSVHSCVRDPDAALIASTTLHLPAGPTGQQLSPAHTRSQPVTAAPPDPAELRLPPATTILLSSPAGTVLWEQGLC